MSDRPKLRLARLGDPARHPSELSPSAAALYQRNADLARRLTQTGALDLASVQRHLGAAQRTSSGLADHLIRSALVPERLVLEQVAALDGCALIDLKTTPPDPRVAHLLPAHRAVALGAVLFADRGSVLVVCTHRTDLFEEIRAAFPDRNLAFCLALRADIDHAIIALYGEGMARRAEVRAPRQVSSRVWRRWDFAILGAVFAGAMLLGFALAPMALLHVLFAISGVAFLANIGLKFLAICAGIRAEAHGADTRLAAIPLHREPVVSILVPLFRERDIAGQLLSRLSAIDYPRDKLDVIFVLEANDATTRGALEACDLPYWARAITVPAGAPQTKPRALNFALPFARGTIIGIYDAEDMPEPDQLRRVTERFTQAGPEVACLQGQLDYYNAGHNWLSRCFAIEYASWFRLLLPGVARLGLVVPLGGTTLFLKRDALLAVGAWDAHNVTEDAELGLRLACNGYRTELIQTTTFEEANSELWAWIKQRSRWLKGYAITWMTVMRRPLWLLRRLGWRRFLGVQVQFAGTVLGFLTAPLIWSLAIVPLGLWHPVGGALGSSFGQFLTVVFVASLLLTLFCGWRACAAPHLRRLRAWLPSLVFYFPLASLAMVVAFVDLICRPFHWIKTAHGRYGAGGSDPACNAAEACSLSRTSNAVDRCETKAL